jgi:ataxia telangiectasia mutated family protein
LKKSKFLLKKSIEEFDSVFQKDLNTQSKEHSIGYYLKSIDLYAHLLNETKSENPIVIMRDLLGKSMEYIERFGLSNKPGKMDLVVNAFHSLAKFADVQYQSTCEFIKSKSVGEHSEVIKQLQIEKNKTKSIEPEGHFYRVLNNQHKMDSEEMNELQGDKEEYLWGAVRNYLNCLELGQKVYESANDTLQTGNSCIFRLVSLWTENSCDSEVNKIIEDKIYRISTYKFLPLMHQISARISLKALSASPPPKSLDSSLDEQSDERAFQNIFISLITNISQDHPHHALPVLFAFLNSNKDYLISNANAAGSSTTSRSRALESEKNMHNYLMTEDRVATASYIINGIKYNQSEQGARLKGIIEAMATLCDAYIELANTPVTEKLKPNESLTFPKHLIINKVKNFCTTSIITNQIPVSPDGKYDESKLVYIVKFNPKFKVANGINLPKIVHCYGSDGIGWKQLVKGKDDLRQDAVMQQFFATVNDFINFNNLGQNTIKLNKIRTYKIVPLSKKSGVLEWCQNTITLGKYK